MCSASEGLHVHAMVHHIGISADWKASRLDTVPTTMFQVKSPQKLAVILSLNFSFQKPDMSSFGPCSEEQLKDKTILILKKKGRGGATQTFFTFFSL